MIEIFVNAAFKTMSELVASGNTFQHNSDALYAVDATVQESTKRGGLNDAAKPMFSRKHKAYCLKTEIGIQPTG